MEVPAGIVDGLRQAVFAKIGEAGEAVNESAFAKDRMEHPEWFVVPTNDLVEMYELLEVIGWKATVPPIDVDSHDIRVAERLTQAGIAEAVVEPVTIAGHPESHDNLAASLLRGSWIART